MGKDQVTLMDNSSILDNLQAPLFDALAENIPVGVCIVDREGFLRYWNRVCEEMYSAKRNDVLGAHISEMFPFSILPRVLEEQASGNATDIYFSRNESVVMNVAPIKDQSGQLLGCISIEQDISAYEKVMEMLEETKGSLRRLKKELNQRNEGAYSFDKMIGQDPEFVKQVNLCRGIAPSTATLLLQGESGTGKEVFARAIHVESGRDGAFVAVNCSSIPFALFESELFGYEKGAFTGAEKQGKIGIIQAADRGTLFLDELGELPENVQPKLLRALESGTITRVGGTKEIPIDIRIICATNQNVKELVATGRFRQDLYYRLSAITIELIPLRKRRDDILIFAEHYLAEYCRQYGLPQPEIPFEIQAILRENDWEGNVRQLKNCLERVVILMKSYADPVLRKEYLGEQAKVTESMPAETKARPCTSLNALLEETEKNALLTALQAAGGNLTEAAKFLEIPRTTLYYKMTKYNITIHKEIDV